MILHIVKRSEWDEAVRRGIYAPPTVSAEGIVHCSTIAQTLQTANRFFRGQEGLVLLCIDERLLTAALKYQPPAITHGERPSELFPHIHGPLNLDAVTHVVDFPCEPDGSFRLPAHLRNASA